MRAQTDIVLRALTSVGAPALVKMLTGAAPAEALPTEFPSAKDRRVDALLRLDDDSILHLEWQSRHDDAMPWRMLGYRLCIADTYGNILVRQIVVQIGGDRPVVDHLELPNLSFRYQVIDSRDLDPAPLLASPELDDALLAVVCGPDERLPEVMRDILRRIAAAAPTPRRDALARLTLLASRRLIRCGVLSSEESFMPITITWDELRQSPLIGAVIRQHEHDVLFEGMRNQRRLTLMHLLERRFPQALDAATRARIDSAEAQQLELWFDRAIDAPNIAAVFAAPQSLDA